VTVTGTEKTSSPVRIRVERGREELRDYFLRLGATVSIDETGAASVRLRQTDDDTVAQYLTSCTSVNGLSATIEPAPLYSPSM
jgi:hypothetical protein